MFYVFWAAAALLAYTFVGYPVLIFVLAKIRRKQHRREAIEPQVSVILTTHNQPRELRGKLENTLALDYPAGKLEIIVGCDACNEETLAVAHSYAAGGVKVVEVRERAGKHHAQQRAIAVSQGEILIFTDVAIQLDSDAARKIVSNFADPSVGCVSSEDRVLQAGGEPEGSYIGVETLLRRLESQANSLVGLSGSFFAVRRELCEKWHPTQSSDFFVALHTVEDGYRAVVDPESVGAYGVTPSRRAEFWRKVRTVNHGLVVLFAHLKFLNPVRFRLYAWQLASHKLLRWMTPLLLLAVLVSNLFLLDQGWFYRATLAAQLAGYLAGVLALFVGRLAAVGLFRAAGFSLLSLGAIVVAWIKFASGEKYIVWQPTKRA